MTESNPRNFIFCAVVGFLVCIIIVAPKTSVLLLIALLLVGCVLSKRAVVPISARFRNVVWGMAFVIWALITVIWSPEVSAVGGAVVKASGLIVCGMITWAIFSFQGAQPLQVTVIRRALVLGISSGLIFVVVATLYGYVIGDSLWGSYFDDPLTTLNNSAVVIALLIWAALIVVVKYSVKYAVFCFVLMLVLLLSLPSLAAIGAVLIGAFVVLLRRSYGHKGGIFFAVVAALLLVSAPYVVKISGADVFASREAQTANSSIPPSARHRLAMWSFAVEKIEEKPWLGWGFGASRHIPQDDRRLAPNMEIMPLHPHNLALQTRLELGLPGSLILAGLVFSVFYRLATFTDDGWKSGFAMAPAAGWLFVANVSYGMWQSWWIALAFLIAILMKLVLTDQTASDVKI